MLWGAATLLLVAVLAVAGLWWWAGTDGSLATALRQAGRYQPLTADNATGSLRAGGHVDRLQWNKDGLAVDARDVTLAWEPWALLHGTLKLDRIAAGSVQVDDARTPSNTPSTAPTAVGLPVRVTLDDFSVGALRWNGTSVITANAISGKYHFTGQQHELDLTGLQFAQGVYNGRAVLTSVGPLRLDATLVGMLTTAVPGSGAPLGLKFTAAANGVLTDLQVKAEMTADTTVAATAAAPARPASAATVRGARTTTPSAQAQRPALQPQATATARVMPWAAQPLPQAQTDFNDLDLGALWPDAPRTQLTGSASVRPVDAAVALADAAWQLTLDVSNRAPGPWDHGLLPLDRVQTQAEWRSVKAAIPAPSPPPTAGLPGATGSRPSAIASAPSSPSATSPGAAADSATYGIATLRSFKALLAGGEINASGEWASRPMVPAAAASQAVPAPLPTASGTAKLPASAASRPAPPKPVAATTTPAQAWQLEATLSRIDPARLHSQLAPLPLDGKASARSAGGLDAVTAFDVALQAAGAGRAETAPPRKAANAANRALGQLRMRDATAVGQWSPQTAGGAMLTLTALRLRTDDAELKGELQAQTAAQAGKGRLTLTAPGLNADVQGELRPASGAGTLAVRGRDTAQLLAWLQKLPVVGDAVAGISAAGSANLDASWRGGWQDPTLQARLDAPSLDVRMTAGPAPRKAVAASARTDRGTPAAPSPATVTTATVTTATATTANSPAPAAPDTAIRIRNLQADLSGKLSQAQLTMQGRAELGPRRFNLQLAAEGGRGARTAAGSAWQGLVKQLSLAVEDPSLGSGAWRLATRGNLPLHYTPTAAGGAFDSGAGEAVLTAPAGRTASTAAMAQGGGAANTTASQAVIAWQPVRWRPGEFVTAGKITGLPLAWVELVAGPQLAGAGLTGNLVFDGEWDARLADTLQLKASISRSSGDLTVQQTTAEGTSTRVAAGVKAARIAIASQGDALTLSLLWDSERAGTANGQIGTRLTRAPAGEESAAVGGWLWPDSAPLTGQLKAQLPRIGVWSVLAPPGWRLRGSLGADVTVSGTRGAPLLAGNLAADDLALRSVVDGIEFGNGRLRAQLDGTRMRISEFTLQGAGDKGTGGLLSAQGEAGWVDGAPQARLNATLTRLRASIRTDRQLTVSGTVRASLDAKQTELTGQLTVDQARILLPDEGTPTLGDDVVVRTATSAAAGQKAPEKTSTETGEKAARPLKLAVAIDLGRDFRVQGKGIDTRLRGTLNLAGASLADPRLTGTINTDGGQYRAYGQRLDVEQGVIRFTGAIDNPTLDILAIRPNLTQRVGVQITGTALLPRVRLYAQPELADAEKLSWLVVGRASASGGAEAALLQQAALALLGSKGGGMSGGLAASLGLDELSYRGSASNADGSTSQGAVTLGKRFSRNFYAAYERSLSGALGTLFIFYDLSQRFTVRAQAGEQSAVDLIFTVPYD